ncbi:transposase [Paenibacillus sp. USDA918EY]
MFSHRLFIKKNGKYRGRQRYLCKDCGKTFNDMTNTPYPAPIT